MSRLGQDLEAVKAEFELVSKQSSRLVANRIQHAASDYWKAVESYSGDDFETAKHLVSAGLVELNFIHKLLEAEITERDLGDSEFFEYADKSDSHSSLDRIDTGLELISVELKSFLGDCKRARKS